VSPTLDELYAVFPDRSDRCESVPVPADAVPEPYRSLLVHTHHMTVTVERFYGSPVDVRVLDVVRAGDSYSRKILLGLRSTGKVVQFGIVHVDLSVLVPTVRDAIVAGQTPLGRVLIENDVLRTVNPAGFFRVTPSPAMAAWLGSAAETYGRIGVITADGKPAVRVAEILTAIDSSAG
jgi:chorismate-pyruvate lyase